MMTESLSKLWHLPKTNTALEPTSNELTSDKTLSELQDILRSDGSLFATGCAWKPVFADKPSIAKAVKDCDLVLLTKQNIESSKSEITAFSLTTKCELKDGFKLEFRFFAEDCQLDICTEHLAVSLMKCGCQGNVNKSMGLLVHVPLMYNPILTENKLFSIVGARNKEDIFANDVAACYIETHSEGMVGQET